MSSNILNHATEWREIAGMLEADRELEHPSRDYLDYRINLARAYARAGSTFIKTDPQPLSAKKRPSPALGPDDVPFDREILKRLLDDIIRGIENRNQESQDLSRLFKEAEKDPGCLEPLVREAVFKGEGQKLEALADKTGTPLTNLLILGRILAAPFLIEAVRGLRPLWPEAAGKSGSCPFCGSPPGLARIRRDDGRRLLVCSLCETEWAYPRLKCPFCQNTDQDVMGTLTAADSDARWLEVCDNCKSYIKTVDERKLPPETRVIPFVEETTTLLLDLLAEREGYSRSLY